MNGRFHPEADAPQAHDRPVRIIPSVQSIMSMTAQHLPDGNINGVELRTAGPLERQPRVAAALLRQLADSLDPPIATATALPENGHPAT